MNSPTSPRTRKRSAATLIDRTIREKIVLVARRSARAIDEAAVDASLDELELLVDTAGADVVARLVQRRDAPDHTWYIGKGKAEELKQICLAVDADTVVFDNELAPAQQFNLEKLLGRTAIDRTAVILDIFGQNAHTLEGKAQVELALLRYRLPAPAPRPRRQPVAAARRRRRPVRQRRDQARGRSAAHHAPDHQARVRPRAARGDRDRCSARAAAAAASPTSPSSATPTPASRTLLNRLTDAGVLVEDRLFATLDPTTRRLSLPGGEPVLLTDTVGFVRNLPHGLIEAFKGTLEVAARADYLVHVVDAGAPDPEGQIEAVRTVLDEIDAGSGARVAGVQQVRPRPRRSQAARLRPPRFGRGQRAHRRGHRRLPAHARRPPADADAGRRADDPVRPR